MSSGSKPDEGVEREEQLAFFGFGPDDARAMLEAGAVAVQVDAAAWRDPRVFERLAEKD